MTNKTLQTKIDNRANYVYGMNSENESLITAFKNGADYVLSHIWTSVKNSVPDNCRTVLIHTINNEIFLGAFFNGEWKYLNRHGELNSEVTHWMEIPEIKE